MTNEQRKQEAIKKAYGEYFEQAKPDEYGWCKYEHINHKIFQKLAMEGFSSFCPDKVRPKSLAGIENNRGWIRVEEDGSNLPALTMENKDDKYWLYNTKREINQLPLSWLHTFKRMEEKHTPTSIITHYQPIIKPEPPIY